MTFSIKIPDITIVDLTTLRMRTVSITTPNGTEEKIY
jgi:hypothetical protein